MLPRSQPVEVLRKVVIDGFLFCGLVLCVVATEKLWRPFQRGFFCGDQTLMYPYNDDTISGTMLRLITLFLPLIIFIVCEVCLLHKDAKVHKCFGITLPTWMVGLYCVLVSFSLGYCFIELTANIAKMTIGRLRPHFFDLCRPSVNCSQEAWHGRYVHPYEYICLGDRVDRFDDMRRSFLSGHSALSAYAMVYIAVYLQSRISRALPRTVRHTIQFAFLMLSWYTALSRITDFKHHWSDVLAGYSAGCIVAVIVWFFCTDLIQHEKKHKIAPQLEIYPICNTVLHEVVANRQGAPPAMS